jgi:hypothetical protein
LDRDVHEAGECRFTRVFARVLALFRAGLAQHWAGGAIPLGPLLVHGSLGALAALLVRDVLPPSTYALALLSLSAALLTLPLLGDLAPLLRADPSQEWLEAQPVTRRELRLARSLVAATVVLTLAAASLVPAAALAPPAMAWDARLVLLGSGLLQALVVAAALLAVFSLLGGRAESALVLLQTLLFALVAAGALIGLRHVPELAKLPRDAAWPAWYPPAWFASVLRGELAAAASAGALALGLLFAAPSAPAPQASGRSALGTLLGPLLRVAARTWVRREERATFELVARALPLERDVVLRTYPLVGIALAFLFAGARGEGAGRDALLALLLFMPPVWLPVLLVQVPGSASHGARWILDGSPLDEGALHAGARKALVVRFLVPLYVALGVLAAWSAGAHFALCVTPPAFLTAVLLSRQLYANCVHDLPLSRAPDDLLVELDWTGTMLGIGLLQAVLAVLAWKFLGSWQLALLVSAILVGIELGASRAAPKPS